MTFAVGFFDLFSFAIPGALQLSLIVYVLSRLHIAGLSAVAAMPAALLVVAAVAASYVLGNIFHPLGAQLERLLPRWRVRPDAARREFLARVPQAQDRPYVHADPALLLAAAEQHNKDAVGDIGRMRALSVMLRNIAFTLIVAMVAALAELAVGGHKLLAGCCAALLLVAALGAMREGRKLQHVSRLKTLEVCFWIPSIDEPLAIDRP
ncbi:hypothetical protein [Amycolatopsis nigrescens]|uniref:hypothetical protein n=1 Tax=Amycolatopsis nigrescens TaxID=381445 RepID=UPI000372C432|nr:hypothetical protein [Amycolatopsis nigrescens]